MQIQKLKITNFRNYDHLEMNFSKKVNIIFGKNGCGKTNLVESIYFLALTKTFRSINDKIIIKDGTNKSIIEGEIIKNQKKEFYKLQIDENGKTVTINKIKIKALSDYISKINIVLFNPNDLKTIKDTPSLRRKNLNVDLSQLDNEYLKNLNDYNRVLKQRNNYLRTLYINRTASLEYLNIITDKLIQIGQKINNNRNAFFEEVNNTIANNYQKICNLSDLKIKYISDFNNISDDKLKEKYKKSIEKDIILGKTQIGIHHDDYRYLLNKKDLKEYGSEGQQKNAIISYKLSALNIFFNKNKTYPILILDDLFSELDNQKINNILKLLKKRVQVFITVTDLNKVSEKLLQNCKIIEIKKGKAEVITNGT